jgi:hypothetical protein
VYNDFFKTMHTTEQDIPSEWPDLIKFNSFQSEFDDADMFPNSLMNGFCRPSSKNAFKNAKMNKMSFSVPHPLPELIQ